MPLWSIFASLFRRGPRAGEKERLAEETAARIVAEAEARQKELLLAAKEESIRLRGQIEAELKELRLQIQRDQNRVHQKEETLERKSEELDRLRTTLQTREAELSEQRSSLEELRAQRLREVERVASMTSEEARSILLKEIEGETRDEANRLVRVMEAQVKEDADRRARSIIAATIQRMTADVTSETTVTVVPIPSDEMKGRIIGREGRNIRAIEAITGVDLIIDDTPDVVMLSSFDSVRREIARVTLTKLIQDGRIHPTRVEEIHEKAKHEVEATIRQAGEQAAIDAQCTGLNPEVIKTLGRLKFRTSYGQNQLRHAVETAHLAAMVATEIGADVAVARRGGLLHDLGKAVDHEVEGTHASIGADLARRFGVSPAVIHCIEAHHEEVEASTVEAIVVMIADSVSGGRPGARRESLERYIKRLQDLEGVANSFSGVEKCFAIQAGREVRIIVKPEQVDDLASMRLARDISKKIEESLEYPGQIKVTVVRETRATEYAR